jgi:probable HAF family extracellular repeat protein
MGPTLMTLWLMLSEVAGRKSAPLRRPPFRRPLLEALEDRWLLSGYGITQITVIQSAYNATPPSQQHPVSAINNATVTQVAGTAATAPGAYVWDSVHGLQQIGTVNHEANSAASSINNAGQVVGVSSTTTEKYDRRTGHYDSSYTENDFLWTSSAGMTNLGSNVVPEGINNSGQITGNPTVIQSTGTEALLWNGKTWLQLGVLTGGANSVAFAINDYGQVVGYSQIINNTENVPNAFLWTPSSANGTSGSMINLGSFMSPGDSTAVAINGKGWVTGNAAVPLSQPVGGITGVDHAFLWKPTYANGTSGTMIDLGTLDPKANGGLGQSWGLAINGSGVVVGQSNPTGATSEYQTDAVIWQPGTNGSYTLSDLNSLIPTGTGWTLWRADAINDNGQIVVEATNSSLSGWYALLLTPTTTTAAVRMSLARPAATVQTSSSPLTTSQSKGYLVVGSYDNNMVLRYNESTGAIVDEFDPKNLANLRNPFGGVFGSDGNLYVGSGVFTGNPQVVQYNGTTGAFRSVFARQNLTSPRGVLFGPDGNLYVADGNDAASGDPASIERFDGRTGAFLNYFVSPTNNGGLEHPTLMVFGPDGKNDGKLDLYVSAIHQGAIYRYDGTTGAFKGQFVPVGSGGLDAPAGLVFGPDGNLYVSSGNWWTSSNGPAYSGDFPAGAVLKYEGPSGPNPGAFLGTFVAGGSGGLANPYGLVFGPDPSGNGKTDLYVASSQLHKSGEIEAENGSSQVLRYDATTGAFLGVFVTPESGGLRFPTFLTFTETSPTTLNYVGTTTPTAQTAVTISPPKQPAAATLTTGATPVLSSTANLAPGSNRFDPSSALLALALSPLPGMPPAASSPAPAPSAAPLLAPSLTSNLPPSGAAGSGGSAGQGAGGGIYIVSGATAKLDSYTVAHTTANTALTDPDIDGTYLLI